MNRNTFRLPIKVSVFSPSIVIPFSKETGLIGHARSGDQALTEKGPFLNMDVNLNHLTGAEVRNSARKLIVSADDWKKTGFTYKLKDSHVIITITGAYGTVRLDMLVDISPEGKITFDYATSGEPNGYLCESGLKFYLDDAIDHLQWKRQGYWSAYPAGDFAGNEGEAPFYVDIIFTPYRYFADNCEI